ncbi:hypothetical protein INT46_008099 [Mucor plumbeus]|uniref:Uncharacterized protein n=1 Tax=Mucor plumbeus TaxID=97098 RepID=A0A8H7RLY4_9FUNG|nr:hypothetical protein INT46_008099 [Mucor plumbeus]
MSNTIDKQTTGTATKDCQKFIDSANNNLSVSSDMNIETETSLSSGQNASVLSNYDALHSEDNACRKYARITRELSEEAFPHCYDGTIMSDSEFDIQLAGDECPSLGKEQQVKLLNEIKPLRVQLYKAAALSVKHIV